VPSILISSAGRKISLLSLFQTAAHARGWQVIAGDFDPLAPTMFMADEAVQLPAVNSDDHLAKLLDVVRQHDVRLIVPGIDTELLLQAENAERFLEAGCRFLGSRVDFVRIVRDKWATAAEFSRRGIATPKSWLPDQLTPAEMPQRLFVKPRNGSGSMHAYRATLENLATILPQVPDAIVQEELDGAEITIDALLDFSGKPLHYVPRVRVRTLGGESIQGRTIANHEIRSWIVACLEQAGAMGAAGVLTVQAFLTATGPVLTEINPRFGGGFPLSYAAGAHYPEWILCLLEGREVRPRLGQYTSDLYMTRYFREHIFHAAEMTGGTH
jgi:carbamoyl-phosphate synthase large subunit